MGGGSSGVARVLEQASAGRGRVSVEPESVHARRRPARSQRCGAKQKGVNGLGSLWASVGVESVHSHEKLCPQYLLRTDEMDYHIRPMDLKHAVVLPVGKEAQFKIKKDRMLLKIPDRDKKERSYQVVSMQPPNSDSKIEGSAYRPMDKDKQNESRPMSAAGNPNSNPVTDRPPQP
jgi:hypothetical protein